MAPGARRGRGDDAGGAGAVERVAWLLAPAVLALVALRPLGPVRDPDTFWHLRAGEHLWATGQFVLDDPFGAGAQQPWVLHEWLPELALHGADAWGGLPAVAWLLCVGVALVAVSVAVACRRRATPLVTALVLATTFVALAASLSPRPQLVTFALVPVVVDAWLRTLDDGRPRWWLVPLTWLWACCHGMWFVGVGVGVLAVAGGLLDGRLDRRAALRLAAVPVASLVASALTPVGPRLLLAPFEVGRVTPWVTEWQRTPWSDVGLWAVVAMLVPVVLGVARWRELRCTTASFAVVALYLALAHARTVALAGVLVAPFAARALTLLTRRSVPDPTRRERWAGWAAPVLALALAAGLAPRAAAATGLGAPGLDDSLRALPPGTVVCSDETLGGWLEWAHPGLRPTMDTRVEIRSAERIAAYHAFVAGAPGWTGYRAAVGCTAALLPGGARVVPELAAHGWVRVAEADGSVLLAVAP